MAEKRASLQIGEHVILAGETRIINLPVAMLYTHSEITLPVQVIHSTREGPRLFVSASVHGDELNGVEIIRRLLKLRTLRYLRGTLIIVPVVNVFGLINLNRYLPDRRDLNRFFPGSEKGSLASRLAHLFMREIADICSYGIDLHTGSNHRTNLPQIRACIDHDETRRLAIAFGAPVILDANLRDGSLRQAVFEKGTPMLLYEAGEALRFNEFAIRAGVRGIVAVMRSIKMLPRSRQSKRPLEPLIARSSSWVRAPKSGILHLNVRLGDSVVEGELLGHITDPFGANEVEVRADKSGVIIGHTKLPPVYRGDALFNVAHFADQSHTEAIVEAFEESIDFDIRERY